MTTILLSPIPRIWCKTCRMANMGLKTFGLATLRGLGQVMLQGNAATGTFFVAGLAVISPPAALAAVLGSAGGWLAALLLRFPAAERNQGLYGFNAALVAIAGTLFPLSVPVVATAIGMGFVATLLMRLMVIARLPAFTGPFVVVTWAFFAIAAHAHWLALPPAPRFFEAHRNLFDAILQGYGQIMFQASSWAGLLFTIGVMASSWRAAFWGLAGSVAGIIVALGMHWRLEEIFTGLYGFNAVLAAIALHNVERTGLLAIGGILMSVALTKFFFFCGIPALTAPFVISTWAILLGRALAARVSPQTLRSEGITPPGDS